MTLGPFGRATAVIVLTLLAALCPAAAGAADVEFSGPVSFTFSGTKAVLNADRIENHDSVGVSGALRLELWSFPLPFDGHAEWGLPLAKYSLAPLAAKDNYTSVTSGPVPFVLPLNGTWNMVMFLTEFTNSSSGDGYSIVDFVNLSPPLVVTNSPLPAEAVIEYYYPAWDAYFVTGIPAEIAALDSGKFPGWERTGFYFNAFDPAKFPPADSIDVCRFFNTSFAPKSSHFYALHGLGCEQTMALFPDWQLESTNAFSMLVPDLNGNCPEGSGPIYRMYNNGVGGAPNHRYTPSVEVRDEMIAAGWTPEGYGIGVEFCQP